MSSLILAAPGAGGEPLASPSVDGVVPLVLLWLAAVLCLLLVLVGLRRLLVRLGRGGAGRTATRRDRVDAWVESGRRLRVDGGGDDPKGPLQ